MKLTPTRREGRGWPHYILWGRVRTSTAALLAAFIAVWWLYVTYQPAPPAPEPANQVVPPGFIPDPSYTWVPRTEVRTTIRTTTTPPTTTTTTTTETTEPTTSETSPTPPTSPTTTTSVAPPPFQIPGLPTPTPTPIPSPAPGQGPMLTPAAPTQ
ncbi:conserved hypothetical protein [uncultured Mycobacterium sp.]|uniref:Proline rich protein n=1 Tax=uncultured Mycobacterium sp. TaxID=171292 RepID=A0A1Y5PI77_9MYCO|nr:conserved hypothetical protein [uncultured Mycobacterium sp.]